DRDRLPGGGVGQPQHALDLGLGGGGRLLGVGAHVAAVGGAVVHRHDVDGVGLHAVGLGVGEEVHAVLGQALGHHGEGEGDVQIRVRGLELGDGVGRGGVGGRVGQSAALDVEVDLGQLEGVDGLAVGRRQRVRGGAGGGQLRTGGTAEGDPDVTALGAQRADL